MLAPVLGRPHRAAPLVESLAASVTGRLFHAGVMFLVSPDDHEQEAACFAVAGENASVVTVAWERGPGDYGRKINYGWSILHPDVDFALLGADDLAFHPGWLEAAVAKQLETGVCVIGTNDLGNNEVMAGRHATHSLVHRDYTCGTIDDPDPGKLLHEGYDHQQVDNEFVRTALARQTFAAATDSIVEHLHPFWHKGATDATYEKALANGAADRARYKSRERLWEGL